MDRFLWWVMGIEHHTHERPSHPEPGSNRSRDEGMSRINAETGREQGLSTAEGSERMTHWMLSLWTHDALQPIAIRSLTGLHEITAPRVEAGRWFRLGRDGTQRAAASVAMFGRAPLSWGSGTWWVAWTALCAPSVHQLSPSSLSSRELLETQSRTFYSFTRGKTTSLIPAVML